MTAMTARATAPNDEADEDELNSFGEIVRSGDMDRYAVIADILDAEQGLTYLPRWKLRWLRVKLKVLGWRYTWREWLQCEWEQLRLRSKRWLR